MTQAQLELARLGMSIARMQLKTMQASTDALQIETNGEFIEFEKQMAELCDKIYTGEIRGTDSGTA